MSETPLSEQVDLADLQQSENNFDFAYMRKKDNTNYRNLCRSYSKMIDPPNLEKLAIFIIKKPGDRYEDEVNILHKWTQRFKFFQELNAKQSNIDMRIHEKCCMKMKYEKIEKGKQVFMAGDIPEKFYIILSGSVNVLLQKSQDVLHQETIKAQELFKKSTSKDQTNSISARVSRLLKKRQVIKKIQEKHQESLALKEMELEKKESDESDTNSNIEDNNDETKNNDSFNINLTSNDIDQTQNDSLKSNEDISPKNSKLSQRIKEKQERKSRQGSARKLTLRSEDSDKSELEKEADLILLKKKDSKFGTSMNQYEPVRKSILYQESIQSNQLTLHLDSYSQQQSIESLSSPKRSQNRAQTKLTELYRNSIFQNAPQYSSFSGQSDYLDLKRKQEHYKNSNQSTMNYDSNKPPQSQLFFQTNQSTRPSQMVEVPEAIKKDSSKDESFRKSIAAFGSETSMEDVDLDEKELDNDPVYKGLGQIKLSDLSDPDKFITREGVLKHTYLVTLETGQMFGELGLLMKKPRAATIVAKEDTEFAVLDAQDYIQIFLLQNCGREVVVKFSYNFEKYKFEKGQYIYTQNESPKFVYLIKKGTIQISKKLEVNESLEDVFDYGYKNPQSELRKEMKFLKQQKQFIDIVVNEYTNGQSFGEMEIMQQCPRSTSAICTSLTATIYALSIKNFLVLLQENKFLVKDFQKQINMKEEFQKNKIKLYLDSIKQQNEQNKQHIQERERIVIKNRKFNKYKENPTHIDTIFKPSVTEFGQLESLSDKKQSTIEQNNSPRNINQQQKLKQSSSTSPKRVQPHHSHQYTPQTIEQQCYINENGNRQIDVADELFENSTFSQFLHKLIKQKKQKLQQFQQSKANNQDGINNSEIFASMLYVEQLKKQMNMMHDTSKNKLGMVKLKKILHQNGLDIKDTVNLELLLMQDEQLKQIISSPLHSSRSISNHHSPNHQNMQNFSDHINEVSGDVNNIQFRHKTDLDDSVSNSPYSNQREFGQSNQRMRQNKSMLNNNSTEIEDSGTSSPQNQYYNNDWEQFLKRYKHKLKNIKSLEKKSPSLKKTLSNAVSDRFFQETLQLKKNEQSERKSYLQNLQNSFECKSQTENEKFQTTYRGDTSRDSYLFSTVNSNKLQFGKDKSIDSQEKINIENNSISTIGNVTQDQAMNFNNIMKRDSYESQVIKNKIQIFDNWEKNEENKKEFFPPNRLPKIEQTSVTKFSSSDLESKQSLNQLKSLGITANSKNQSEKRKSSLSQRYLDVTAKSPIKLSHSQTGFTMKNSKRLSFENKFIQSKVNPQKQATIQTSDNQQMHEYYVNSQYLKPTNPAEFPNFAQTNRSTNQSSLNQTQSAKKIPKSSFIAQIDLGCGFSNSVDNVQINNNRSEETKLQGAPQNYYQVLKILSKGTNNQSQSPPKSNNENTILQNKSNVSTQEQNMRYKNHSNRILVGKNSQSTDKKNISIQLERTNIDQIGIGQSQGGKQQREEYMQDAQFGSIFPSSTDQFTPQTIQFNEIKKSMSFTSKHNMFRTKPSKLYLIDRYSRDHKSESQNSNSLKPINHLIDMQIKKLKLQHQGQNQNNQHQ